MTENVENLILEHLKKLQAGQAASEKRDQELLSRMNALEKHMARIGRDTSFNYEELIENRHMTDRLIARIERIEKRLELND